MDGGPTRGRSFLLTSQFAISVDHRLQLISFKAPYWIIKSGALCTPSSPARFPPPASHPSAVNTGFGRWPCSAQAARGEAGSESDVDVCIEFKPGHHPGVKWFDLEEELEARFVRRVDLSRKSLLKPHVRSEALRDAVVLYAP